MAERLTLIVFALAVLLFPQVALAEAFDDAVAAYERGDYQTAFRGFKGLADQGNAKAQASLGEMYMDGLVGPYPPRKKLGPARDKKALVWFRRAASQNNASGQYNLGAMYQLGRGGVPKSYKEAVKLYRKAANQGNAKALSALGEMYEFGKGVPQSYREAVQWYQRAANQGYRHAQFWLGLLYSQGREGVPQDPLTAYMWLLLSSVDDKDGKTGENLGSRRLRDSVEKKLTPAQIAKAQKMAMEWKPTPTR